MTSQKSDIESLLQKPLSNDLDEIHSFIAELESHNYSIVQIIRQLCNKLQIGLFYRKSKILEH